MPEKSNQGGQAPCESEVSRGDRKGRKKKMHREISGWGNRKKIGGGGGAP